MYMDLQEKAGCKGTACAAFIVRVEYLASILYLTCCVKGQQSGVVLSSAVHAIIQLAQELAPLAPLEHFVLSNQSNPCQW